MANGCYGEDSCENNKWVEEVEGLILHRGGSRVEAKASVDEIAQIKSSKCCKYIHYHIKIARNVVPHNVADNGEEVQHTVGIAGPNMEAYLYYNDL